MEKNHKISISPEVMSQVVSGETVLLDLKSESYFGLDEVGTRIWQLFQEKDDVQGVIDAMLDEYDVEAAQLETDLNQLLEKLIEAGLVSLESIEDK